MHEGRSYQTGLFYWAACTRAWYFAQFSACFSPSSRRYFQEYRPRVVAVVVNQLYGVLSDGLHGLDSDILLADDQNLLARPVSLYFGGRRMHPQVFERQQVTRPVLERHLEYARAGAKLDFSGLKMSQSRHSVAPKPILASTPEGENWRQPRGDMQPTDTTQPDYFHKVVDCQWACPAHTDVPEYIRLIAQGRFTDAYMVNRHSNVFPGILGRVCDRPCEPACRRGRVEEKPVAICRLKRVAADHRDEDIRALLPQIPKLKNGKKVALIGAGCASLTVANDLMPLGYSVTIFEQWGVPGGLMRTNIPSFRLPAEVLDDEIAQIVQMGVDLKLNTPIKSMRS